MVDQEMHWYWSIRSIISKNTPVIDAFRKNLSQSCRLVQKSCSAAIYFGASISLCMPDCTGYPSVHGASIGIPQGVLHVVLAHIETYPQGQVEPGSLHQQQTHGSQTLAQRGHLGHGGGVDTWGREGQGRLISIYIGFGVKSTNEECSLAALVEFHTNLLKTAKKASNRRSV